MAWSDIDKLLKAKGSNLNAAFTGLPQATWGRTTVQKEASLRALLRFLGASHTEELVVHVRAPPPSRNSSHGWSDRFKAGARAKAFLERPAASHALCVLLPPQLIAARRRRRRRGRAAEAARVVGERGGGGGEEEEAAAEEEEAAAEEVVMASTTLRRVGGGERMVDDGEGDDGEEGDGASGAPVRPASASPRPPRRRRRRRGRRGTTARPSAGSRFSPRRLTRRSSASS